MYSFSFLQISQLKHKKYSPGFDGIHKQQFNKLAYILFLHLRIHTAGIVCYKLPAYDDFFG